MVGKSSKENKINAHGQAASQHDQGSVRSRAMNTSIQQLAGNQATSKAINANTAFVPDIVRSALRSSHGVPLEFGTRMYMEQRFSENFENVRVHTGSKAALSASAVGARAYTVGHDIVFGDGHYAPGTVEGRQLLAHELAHVVQQTYRPDVSIASPISSEQEAHHASVQSTTGQASMVQTAASGLQRAPLTKNKVDLTFRAWLQEYNGDVDRALAKTKAQIGGAMPADYIPPVPKTTSPTGSSGSPGASVPLEKIDITFNAWLQAYKGNIDRALAKTKTQIGGAMPKDYVPPPQRVQNKNTPHAKLFEITDPDGKRRTLTEEEYQRLVKIVSHNLEVELERIEGHASWYKKIHQGHLDNHGSFGKWVNGNFGKSVDWVIGIKPPPLSIWSSPNTAIAKARQALQNGDLKEAGQLLQQAQMDLRQSQVHWNTYKEEAVIGGDKTKDYLETTRDASFAIAIGAATVATGGAIAPIVAEGVTATGAAGVVLTTAGTSLATSGIVGGGAALARGGSAAVGTLMFEGKIDTKEVLKEADKGKKEGLVAGLTAGLAPGVDKVAGVGVNMAQQALRRGAAEGTLNAFGEMVSANLEGKSVSETFAAGGRGLVTGGLSGVLSSVPVGKPLVKKALEVGTGAGTNALGTALSGGNQDDIIRSALIGGVSSMAMGSVRHSSEPPFYKPSKSSAHQTELTKMSGSHLQRTEMATSSNVSNINKPVIRKSPKVQLRGDATTRPVADLATRRDASSSRSKERVLSRQSGHENAPANDNATLPSEPASMARTGTDDLSIRQPPPHPAVFPETPPTANDVLPSNAALIHYPVPPLSNIATAAGQDFSDAGKQPPKRPNESAVASAKNTDAGTAVVGYPEVKKIRAGSGTGNSAVSKPSESRSLKRLEERSESANVSPKAADTSTAKQSVEASKPNKPLTPEEEFAEFENWRTQELGATGSLTSDKLLQMYRHGSRDTVTKYLRQLLMKQAAADGVMTIGEFTKKVEPGISLEKQVSVFVKELEGAHSTPQSFVKKLPVNSRHDPKDMLVILTEKSTHTAMDQPWKDAFNNWRKSGKERATAQEVFDAVAEGIRTTPGMSNSEKASRVARLHDEMFIELKLEPKKEYIIPIIYNWWENL